MFPNNQKSSCGYKYTVYEEELAVLRADKTYMTNWRRGVELLFLSWGWKLYERKVIPKEEAAPGQKWTNYPVRFYKAGLSAKLLGDNLVWDSLKEFTTVLGREQIGVSPDGIRLQKLFNVEGSERLLDPGPRYK